MGKWTFKNYDQTLGHEKTVEEIDGFHFCGEDGIRTREAVYPLAGLANRSFQPLTHLSGPLNWNIAIVERDKSKSKMMNYQINLGESFW